MKVIRQVLDELPGRYGEMLELKYIEEWSVERIARARRAVVRGHAVAAAARATRVPVGIAGARPVAFGFAAMSTTPTKSGNRRLVRPAQSRAVGGRARARIRKTQRGIPCVRATPPRLSRGDQPRWQIAAARLVVVGAGRLAGDAARRNDRPARALDGSLAVHDERWFSGATQPAAGASIVGRRSLTVSNDGGALLRIFARSHGAAGRRRHARLGGPGRDRTHRRRGVRRCDARRTAPLRIVTPHGVVTHLGTQYLVRSERERDRGFGARRQRAAQDRAGHDGRRGGRMDVARDRDGGVALGQTAGRRRTLRLDRGAADGIQTGRCDVAAVPGAGSSARPVSCRFTPRASTADTWARCNSRARSKISSRSKP